MTREPRACTGERLGTAGRDAVIVGYSDDEAAFAAQVDERVKVLRFLDVRHWQDSLFARTVGQHLG